MQEERTDPLEVAAEAVLQPPDLVFCHHPILLLDREESGDETRLEPRHRDAAHAPRLLLGSRRQRRLLWLLRPLRLRRRSHGLAERRSRPVLVRCMPQREVVAWRLRMRKRWVHVRRVQPLRWRNRSLLKLIRLV